MAAWEIAITDLAGSQLPHDAFIVNARITKTWNGPRMMEATMPLTSPAASYIRPGLQLVSATRLEDAGNVVRFHGILWARVISYGANATLALTASDSWSLLGKRITSANFTAQDQGQIVKQLIDAENAASTVRVNTSTYGIPATKTRDRSWADQARPVSEAIQSFTTILDPIDIDFLPRAFTIGDGTIADLVITPRVFSAPLPFTFGHGEGTVNNCSAISDTMNLDDMGNYVIGLGENSISSLKTDPASISQYGRFTRQESFNSVSVQATLDDHTQEVVDTYALPLPIVTVTPRRGDDMMLWDSFNVGDIVQVDARFEDVRTSVLSRVVEATVEIDGTGEKLTSVSLQEVRS